METPETPIARTIRPAGKVQRAHFTLDGEPLCRCLYPANWDRYQAADSPPCEDALLNQMSRFVALASQFPAGRIALVDGPCPETVNL